jgi:hypothetical protein
MFQFRIASGKFSSIRIAYRSLAVLMIIGATFPSSARSDLSSFESGQGYYLASPAWVDVTYYNAGQYGPTAGNGPGPIPIVPDSGLWKVQSQVGAFFSTSAQRTAAVGTAPPYPNPVSVPNTIPVYIVGAHSPGRTGFGSLAVRNDTAPGTGTMEYDYTLDQYDFNGINPSTVTSGNVQMQFYFCPNPTNMTRNDKFIMSLTDSVGNVGLQVGYTMDNEVYWRQGSSGAWNYPGMFADATNWDGFRVQLNLTNDTFGLDYFDVSSNVWLNFAPTGTAMGNSMLDFTHLGWSLADGVNNGVGGKNFFDDFDFHVGVPEPGMASWLAALGFALTWRRPRR